MTTTQAQPRLDKREVGRALRALKAQLGVAKLAATLGVSGTTIYWWLGTPKRTSHPQEAMARKLLKLRARLATKRPAKGAPKD